MKSKLLSVILWSMIAAAFIGPGTLTTASVAGSEYQYRLLWALVFASFACIVIQEASARISIINGRELPEILTKVYAGTTGLSVRILIGGSVIFGCAAYQAGNILGAISGLELLIPIHFKWMVVGLVAFVGILLFYGTYKNLAIVLSSLVGMMGICFVIIVLNSDQNIASIIEGLVPGFPAGSEWLVLGLVGTTIVPYNLFLGSGISKGQGLNDMRWGLAISVILGGLISIAILMTGSLIEGEFSFGSLAQSMQSSLGPWAVYLLGFGLFAAGFTSSVTAPLAAGFISKGFFPSAKPQKSFRIGWLLVLITGLVIGLMEIKPVPVIIMAQALNGFILPVIAVFLMIMVNDPRVLKEKRNNLIQNVLFTVVLIVVVAIGTNNLTKAFSSVFPIESYRLWIMIVITLLVSIGTWWKIRLINSTQQ